MDPLSPHISILVLTHDGQVTEHANEKEVLHLLASTYLVIADPPVATLGNSNNHITAQSASVSTTDTIHT